MPLDQVGFYIELRFEGVSGHTYAHSADVPGLHLLGSSARAMRPMLERAIKRLFLDNHQKQVNVVWMSPAASFPAATFDVDKAMVYPVASAA